MSIQQSRNETPLSNRMVSNTHATLDRIATRYEKRVADVHASIVYKESFWAELQRSLSEYTAERRTLLAAGGYVVQAREFREIGDFAIRTAVEDFRAVCLDDPFRIHDDEAWETFRAGLHSTGTEFDTRPDTK